MERELTIFIRARDLAARIFRNFARLNAQISNQYRDRWHRNNSFLRRSFRGTFGLATRLMRGLVREARSIAGRITAIFASIGGAIGLGGGAFAIGEGIQGALEQRRTRARFEAQTDEQTRAAFDELARQQAARGGLFIEEDFRSANEILNRFNISAEQSVQILNAGRDASAAAGESLTEFATALTRGVFLGESELLERFAITLKEANVEQAVFTQQFLQNTGKRFRSLTEEERIQLRLIEALRQANQFTGVEARLLDDVAGRIQLLQTRGRQALIRLGEEILTSDLFDRALTFFENISLDSIQGILGTVRDLAVGVFRDLADIFRNLPQIAIPILADLGKILFAGLRDALRTAGLLIQDLGLAFVSLANDISPLLLPAFIDLFRFIGAAFLDFGPILIAPFRDAFPVIMGFFSDIGNLIEGFVRDVSDRIDETFRNIGTFLLSIFKSVILEIKALFLGVFQDILVIFRDLPTTRLLIGQEAFGNLNQNIENITKAIFNARLEAEQTSITFAGLFEGGAFLPRTQRAIRFPETTTELEEFTQFRRTREAIERARSAENVRSVAGSLEVARTIESLGGLRQAFAATAQALIFPVTREGFELPALTGLAGQGFQTPTAFAGRFGRTQQAFRGFRGGVARLFQPQQQQAFQPSPADVAQFQQGLQALQGLFSFEGLSERFTNVGEQRLRAGFEERAFQQVTLQAGTQLPEAVQEFLSEDFREALAESGEGFRDAFEMIEQETSDFNLNMRETFLNTFSGILSATDSFAGNLLSTFIDVFLQISSLIQQFQRTNALSQQAGLGAISGVGTGLAVAGVAVGGLLSLSQSRGQRDRNDEIERRPRLTKASR